MNALLPIGTARATALDTPLWTGRPAWRATALRVWKLGWTAAYLAVLLADGLHLALTRPHAPQIWMGELRLALLATALLLGLMALAALGVRTTRYSIEARTVTLRYGLALPARLVIPFSAIDAVAARIHPDGTGDIALRLKAGQGVPYLKLWPHARPWRLRRAEPMLRGVPDADRAAAMICRALAAGSGACAPEPEAG